jgi:hypothetical protein
MILVSGSWRRSYAFVLAATIGVVAAADFFLYGHVLGWTTALVAAALLGLLAMRDFSFLATTGGKIIAAAAAGLLIALIEQPTWLNVAYALVCLVAAALINHFGWQADFWPWARRLGRWLVTAWIWPLRDNSVVVRWLVRRGVSPRAARGIAAWIVPLLLSGAFVALFAWANPVIADWCGRLGTWLGNRLERLLERLPELISFPRLVFWLGFALFAWMLLRGPVRRWRGRRGGARARPPLVDGRIVADPERAGAFPLGLVVRCLILFNLVFAVENALDLRYLYGHQGMTPTEYKQYVRRGAYPLVAAALLAGAFVLITFRPGSRTERSPAARQLVYAWIGQTILLTVSASLRLVKYVEMTELTRLRVASAVWFVLVAAGLVYIIWRIVRGRSNAWLVNVNALTALLLLYPCCFVNFDGIIADFNAAHCRDAGGDGSPLDIEYFRTLGTPALAALDRVKDQLEPGWRRNRATAIARELSAELDADVNDWRSWTWRRQRTADEVHEAVLARAATPQLARATVGQH